MNDVDRNAGRTTGRMLKAMAEASLHRGKWIEFHDHCDQSPEASTCELAAMQQMAEALGLDYDIQIACGRLGLFLILRWPEEQTEPATVSDATWGRNRIGTECWYRPSAVDPAAYEAGRWRAGRLCEWSTDHDPTGPYPVGIIMDDEHGTCHSICIKRICFGDIHPDDPAGTKQGGTASGTTTEEIRRCGVCRKDTKQTVHREAMNTAQHAFFREQFTKWVETTDIADQCGLAREEMIDSVEFKTQEPGGVVW